MNFKSPKGTEYRVTHALKFGVGMVEACATKEPGAPLSFMFGNRETKDGVTFEFGSPKAIDEFIAFVIQNRMAVFDLKSGPEASPFELGMQVAQQATRTAVHGFAVDEFALALLAHYEPGAMPTAEQVERMSNAVIATMGAGPAADQAN